MTEDKEEYLIDRHSSPGSSLSSRAREEFERLSMRMVDLKSELKDVHAKIQIVQAQQDAIRGLLDNGTADTDQKLRREDDLFSSIEQSVKDKSVSEAALKILEVTDKPMRPRDIARRLKMMQYDYQATTELSTRVSSDLSRLVKNGRVKKSGDRYYVQKSLNGADHAQE